MEYPSEIGGASEASFPAFHPMRRRGLLGLLRLAPAIGLCGHASCTLVRLCKPR